MTRPLHVISSADPSAVLHALDTALDGGPALLPVPLGAAIAVARPEKVHERVALVVETSGSTGRPKRVALSAGALLAGAAAADAVLGGAGSWLLALPAHYIAGLNVLVRSIAAGTTPVMLPEGHFDTGIFADAASGVVGERRYTALVPVQLARILDDERATRVLAQFDAVLVGGQSTPVSLLSRARSAGVRVVTTYGASETSGGCVYDARPLPGVDTRVVDGEIMLSGPMLAEGYVEDAARTAATFVVDDGRRWYRTSDAGEIVDGRLRVLGRLDDVIISGGEKVPLGAVERLIREFAGQSAAVVTSRSSAKWGEEPVVVTDTPLSLDDVRERVGAAIGRAARPAAIIVLDALPALASGKPDRRAIRAIAASG